MKIIDVVCAIIEERGKVLAAQRSLDMDLPLMWEFPGGKVEPGEDNEAGLCREIKEELGVEIEIITQLNEVIHKYEMKTIKLIPFVCTIKSGNISMTEHKTISWYSNSELNKLNWCPADVPVVDEYLRRKNHL